MFYLILWNICTYKDVNFKTYLENKNLGNHEKINTVLSGFQCKPLFLQCKKYSIKLLALHILGFYHADKPMPNR